MEIALQEAGEALSAGEFPVGCIAVHDNEVVARGRRINSRLQARNELDHAEINCLRQLSEFQPGIDLARVTFYSTFEPCLMCYGALLINQVKSVVYSYEDAMGGGTGLNLSHLPPFYRGQETEIVPFILREKSLALFQEFFSSPDSSYLEDTYLAKYTLGMLNYEETIRS